MTDPKRLADGGGDLGIASLRAARRDAPPPRSKERALLAIGVLGAAGATSSAATAAGTLFTLGRVLLGLAALGAISASVVVGLSSPPNERRPVASPVGNTASPPPERAVLATPSADVSAPVQPQAVQVPVPEPAPARAATLKNATACTSSLAWLLRLLAAAAISSTRAAFCCVT